MKYDTLELCRELKTFIEKNNDVIMYTGICKRAGVNRQSLANILFGHGETISSTYLNKVLPYFRQFGFIYSGFQVELDLIQRVVCTYFDIPIDTMKSKSQKGDIVQARQFIFKFAIEMTKHSSGFIGKKTGGKDHATVLTGVKTINNRIERERVVRFHFEQLERRIKQA